MEGFKLYLSQNKRGAYWLCRIVRDSADLKRQAEIHSKRIGPFNWTGATGACFKRPGRLRRGLVLLSRADLGIGIISHELTHAALCEAVPDCEEVARLQGWFMVQVFEQLRLEDRGSHRPAKERTRKAA